MDVSSSWMRACLERPKMDSPFSKARARPSSGPARISRRGYGTCCLGMRVKPSPEKEKSLPVLSKSVAIKKIFFYDWGMRNAFLTFILFLVGLSPVAFAENETSQTQAMDKAYLTLLKTSTDQNKLRILVLPFQDGSQTEPD